MSDEDSTDEKPRRRLEALAEAVEWLRRRLGSEEESASPPQEMLDWLAKEGHDSPAEGAPADGGAGEPVVVEDQAAENQAAEDPVLEDGEPDLTRGG